MTPQITVSGPFPPRSRLAARLSGREDRPRLHLVPTGPDAPSEPPAPGLDSWADDSGVRAEDLVSASGPQPQPELAYAVPWLFDRSTAPRFRLVNASMQTLWGVSFTLLGSAVMEATPPLLVEPGGSTVLHIRGHDLARNTVLLVRWFTPARLEYLWRVAF